MHLARHSVSSVPVPAFHSIVINHDGDHFAVATDQGFEVWKLWPLGMVARRGQPFSITHRWRAVGGDRGQGEWWGEVTSDAASSPGCRLRLTRTDLVCSAHIRSSTWIDLACVAAPSDVARVPARRGVEPALSAQQARRLGRQEGEGCPRARVQVSDSSLSPQHVGQGPQVGERTDPAEQQAMPGRGVELTRRPPGTKADPSPSVP